MKLQGDGQEKTLGAIVLGTYCIVFSIMAAILSVLVGGVLYFWWWLWGQMGM